MLAAGANVRRVGVDIPYGTTDDAWLEVVGQNDWIALMRDQKIRRRRLEIEALKSYRVAAFTFTGGQETAGQTAKTICPRLVKFANMSISEPRPFLYTFGVSGTMSRVQL
jgi:hypothetical protein